MRERWGECALRELADVDVDRVPVEASESYRQAGVLSFGRGLFERGVLQGAATSYAYLHRLHRHQLVMSKLKAWEGAFAIVPAEFDGYVLSPEFPTYTVRLGRVDPGYLGLVVSEPAFRELVKVKSKGMGGRKERVNPRALLDVVIPLPPLPEQRRIVDLIQRTQDSEMAAEAEHTAAVAALNALREDLIARHGARERTLREVLADIDGGVSPVTEGRAPVDGERAVLKLSAVRPARFAPAESKAVAPSVALPERALVRVGDVLITRSNTPETVGFVCYVDAVRPDTYLSDLTLRLHPTSGVDRRYLTQALNTGDARRQIMGSAKGTSGSMRKISRSTIRDIRVPICNSLTEQGKIADTLESASVLADSARNSAHRLASLRSALLADLLSGDHEIPPSYDRFLDAAS